MLIFFRRFFHKNRLGDLCLPPKKVHFDFEIEELRMNSGPFFLEQCSQTKKNLSLLSDVHVLFSRDLKHPLLGGHDIIINPFVVMWKRGTLTSQTLEALHGLKSVHTI